MVHLGDLGMHASHWIDILRVTLCVVYNIGINIYMCSLIGKTFNTGKKSYWKVNEEGNSFISLQY